MILGLRVMERDTEKHLIFLFAHQNIITSSSQKQSYFWIIVILTKFHTTKPSKMGDVNHGNIFFWLQDEPKQAEKHFGCPA